MALFPENNKILICLFIISIIVIPFIRNQNKLTTYCFLIFPLYATWKHAMIRESIIYYTELLDFIILFWGIILLTSSSFSKKIYYLIPIVGIIAIFANAVIVDKEFSYQKNMNGFNNIKPFVISYNSHISKFYNTSLSNVSVNKVSEEIKNKIGNKTIDIYPWDFSYIAANEFNWKPRKTFQSIGFSSKIDRISSQCFTREEGPEFILFHAKKDTFGGNFGSIDYRFLLNVEPLTNIEILKNYNIYYRNKKFTLFIKNKEDNYISPVTISKNEINWNEWINCPKTDDGISKVKAIINYNILGKVRQLLYKDGGYYIDYFLTTGEIRTYRFIPKIAKNGIWINPMTTNFNQKNTENTVQKIRFRSSLEYMVKKSIKLDWVFYENNDDSPIKREL
jgi:hypothetical protein